MWIVRNRRYYKSPINWSKKENSISVALARQSNQRSLCEESKRFRTEIFLLKVLQWDLEQLEKVKRGEQVMI